MFDLLSRLDFAWPWAWLLLLLPLLSRFLMPQENQHSERVRVPFLPALIEQVNLDAQPVHESLLRRLLFWLLWLLLV